LEDYDPGVANYVGPRPLFRAGEIMLVAGLGDREWLGIERKSGKWDDVKSLGYAVADAAVEAALMLGLVPFCPPEYVHETRMAGEVATLIDAIERRVSS
jgi:hypothetical protein